MPLDPYIVFGLIVLLWAAVIAYVLLRAAVEKRQRAQRKADRFKLRDLT
jgi:archaellin